MRVLIIPEKELYQVYANYVMSHINDLADIEIDHDYNKSINERKNNNYDYLIIIGFAELIHYTVNLCKGEITHNISINELREYLLF